MGATTKAHALVESAFMVGIATVLSIAAIYIPILSLLSFLLPAPFALLGKRHGVGWSVLAFVVCTFLLNTIMGPIHTFVEMGTFGLTGVFLGIAYHYRWRPILRLVAPTIVFTLGVIVQYYMAKVIMGVDIIEMFRTLYLQTLESFRMAQEQGMQIDTAMLDQLEATSFQAIMIALPATLLMAGLIMAYCNMIVSEMVLRRLHIMVEPFPPIMFWTMPRWILVIFGLSMYAMWQGSVDTTSFLYAAGLNIGMLTRILLFVEGAAFLRFLFYVKQWPTKLYYAIVIIGFFIPLVTMMLTGAGIMELIMQIRKKEGLFERKEEVLRDLRK